MQTFSVAGRYTRALFELALEKKDLETIHRSLTEINEIIHKVPLLSEVLNNPLLSYAERTKIIKALFEGKVPDLLYRFLLLLAEKDRSNLLEQMIDCFDDLYLKEKKQIRVTIETAMPLDQSSKNLIESQLQSRLSQTILPRSEIRPEIIGGFRILAGGILYDYSFKNKLDMFRLKTLQHV